MSFNTTEETHSEISTRIKMLSDMSDADLKTEMQSLKAAILENPAACALLLPEDIGLMVKNLRRITQHAITQAATKPARAKAVKKEKAVPLTAEQLAAALEDDDF